MNSLEKYKNLYKITKTLRFELKPLGKTLDNINKNGVLSIDEERLLKSKDVKKLIDEYSKIQIDNALSKKIFDESIIVEYINNLANKKEKDAIIKRMKKRVITEFTTVDAKDAGEKEGKDLPLAKTLTSAAVFSELSEYLRELSREEEAKKVDFFNSYTTYFTDFLNNREFIFTGEDVGSISYRLIEDNLPIFLDNMNVFQELLNYDLKSEIEKLGDLSQFKEYINFNNVLTQRGIDKYNLLITGKTEESGNKIQGLNELINLYNQKNKTKIRLFSILNKQILSDRQSGSFILDSITEDKEVFDGIDIFLEDVDFVNYFDSEKINPENIYIENKKNISDLSNSVFGTWNHINQKMFEWYETEIDNKTKSIKKFEDNRKKYFASKSHYSVEYLSTLTNTDIIPKIKDLLSDKIIMINETLDEYKKMNRSEIDNLKSNERAIEIIKNLLDSIKDYQFFLKQFSINDITEKKDAGFYNAFDPDYLKLKNIIPLYNKIRSYVTKKPYSTGKVKINFNCPTLLNGWDVNKEKSNLGIMFKKYNQDNNRYDYFLGIMKDNKIFDNPKKGTGDYYEKMEYKLLSGPNKMLPKLFISAADYREKLEPEFLKKYSEGKHKKENLDKAFLAEYISYMQKCLFERYSEHFNFNFRKPNEYNQVDEFYREVESQAYNLKFKNISTEYINECIEQDKLYLFQIYSKDFSKYSIGNPNAQTIYFENIFSDENIKNIVYKLNGEAEIFYRKKSIPFEETHKANIPIENKNKDNEKKTSVFNYPLIKNKRYTEDKFLFHFPITINFKSPDIKNINSLINNNIDEIKHVIGVDRGERNLIYVVVTDLSGNIVEQISLNEIVNEYKNNKYYTDYHKLLDEKSKMQLFQKQSWKTIDTIKELKEGYVSQVVNKIKELVIKYDAVVVLENLSFGFKNSRKKVDNQVYQKFELQLIKKFNYIIDKEDKNTHLNGLQLTNPIVTLDKIGSQSGVVFYIPAWNTSNIDPTTGFVNLIYGLRYTNIEEAKKVISKIKEIRFNGENYEFDVDFSDFNPKYSQSKMNWTLHSYGTRVYNRRSEEHNGNFISEEINLTEEFHKLFEEYNIDKNKVLEKSLLQDQAKFFEKFIFLFKLLLQLRNSFTGTNIDYILSPIKNKNGEFFDSRNNDQKLPKDADANGAYNIARKGIMLLDKIKESEDKNKIDYKITNEEYLINLQK